MIFQICRHFAKTGIQTEWRKPFVDLELLIQHNNHISKPREESYLVQHAIAPKYRIRIVPGISVGNPSKQLDEQEASNLPYFLSIAILTHADRYHNMAGFWIFAPIRFLYTLSATQITQTYIQLLCCVLFYSKARKSLFHTHIYCLSLIL